MTKSRRSRALRYRLLAIVILMASSVAMLAAPTPPPSACCDACLKRFYQCDGNTAVCCKIYSECTQGCLGGCPACPDQ